MSARSSRHGTLGSYRRPAPGRKDDVLLYEPRFAETPAGDRRHTVQAGERLDHLAARYLGDPHQYWRIADANPGGDPDALLKPRNVIEIPEPD